VISQADTEDVRPLFRGKGMGRRLAGAAIDMARQMRYKRRRLDTVASLTEAAVLYRSLGFQEIDPYRYNPVYDAVFRERVL